MNAKNIFGAFTLAIALFFVWPAVFGSWQDVSALRSALADRQALADQRTAILSQVNQQYAQYQALISGSSGKAFTELVPVKKDSAELVSAIQDIANSSGVQVTQIQVSQAKAKEGSQYQTLSMTINLSGSYPGLRAFLTNLEQYVRILNVGNIQISVDQTTGQFNYSIKADAYFLK
jgi:Tfp pilus assembly protein PilO